MKVLRQSDEYPNYYIFLEQASLYLKEGNIEKAIATCNQAIEIEPKKPDAYYSLGLYYHQLGNFDCSITNFEKAADLDSTDASIYNNLGFLYYCKGLFEESKTHFKRSISLEPDYIDALYGLGAVYFEQLKIYDAIAVFKKCLTIEPSLSKARVKLEECYKIINSESVKDNYKKILIVMDEGIGNMVMLTPALRAIKHQLPECRITVLGKQPSVQIVDGWDLIEKVLTEPDDDQYDVGFFSIWSGNYKQKFGEKIKSQCSEVYNIELDNIDMHEAEHHLKIAKYFGYEGNTPEPFCMTKEVNIQLSANKKIAVLSDTTLNNNAWERKRWPYYKELARKLIDIGYAVVLIGGKEELNRFIPSQWPSQIINCLDKYNIQETAWLLKKCDMFIGNDSGPAHIAAALGIPTFVFFGSTRISKNKPLGTDVTIVSKNLRCSPCQYSPMWNECKDWKCMSQIIADDVLQTIIKRPLQQQKYKVSALTPTVNPFAERKVLIVGVLDIDSSTNVFMKKGFEKLGLHVEAYNYRTRSKELGSPQAMWKDFQQFLLGKKYDLIIFCKVNSLHPELIKYASQFGKTWYWFMDNLWVAQNIYANEYVKRADFASSTSKEVCDWFRQFNSNTFQIIEGFDPDIYFHEGLPKIYDLLFVGNATDKRINDLRLLRNGHALTIFGNGWPEDFAAKPPIYNNELRRAICQSKIVLNLVHSNIFSDRIVLTAASGGFVLSQWCSDLERHFQRKTQLDWFRNAEEAQQLILYYLEYHEVREKIAKNGMHYVRQKYNWESVCREVLQKVETSLPRGIAAANRKTAERVLFVSWHGLGDNVMLTPALRKYKQLYPDSYIAVAGLERFGNTLVQLLSGLHFVDEVIPCLPDAWNDFPDYKTGVDAVVERAQAICRERGFSKVVVLPTNRQEGYKLHKNFRFADEVGVQFDNLEDLQTELAVTKEAEKQVEAFVKDYSKPILVLHAKAGNQPKTLVVEDVERIIDQYRGYTVFEFGRRSTSRSILVSEDNMEFSKALIKRADMVIAIDSVVMHIAGAFHRPLIAIFTITPVHQAIPLTYRVDVCGANNDMTQLSLWPSLKKEIEKKYLREKNYGFDQRWYYEGGSSCYMGYWWGERGGMGLRITARMNKIIDEHPEMFENCKVIDVGCAAGYYVKVMRDRGIEAYGCDPSEWIINREETLMSPYKKYLKVGVAKEIPFNVKIDTVLALNVLEHSTEDELSSFLSELNRLQSANLIIQVPQIDDPEAWTDITHKLIKPHGWWNKKFASIGFQLVKNIPYTGAPIWYYQHSLSCIAPEQKETYMKKYNEIIAMAEQLAKNDEKEKAILAYKQAIEIAPEQVSAYYNLAILYHSCNNAENAIANFKKAAHLAPGDATIFNNLGVLHYSIDKPDEAETYFKKAIEIKPDYIDAINGLNKVYQKYIQKVRERGKTKVDFNKTNNESFLKAEKHKTLSGLYSSGFRKLKLPELYHDPICYWAHMITLRCNGGCPFCILNGRGDCQKTIELSAREILNFWNNIEHKQGQRLSLIGGEPTLHKDIVEIVNNLEGYSLTITTNCKGPFYENSNFYKRFNPHPTSTLRINTTFHPHHISAEEYIRVINLYRKTGYFVDQTSYVYRPDIDRYREAIDKVSKEIPIKAAPYLGFYDPENQFQSPFSVEHLEPNENYYDPKAVATMCGLTNFDAYRDMCGQYEKQQVSCEHPSRSLIIGPEGNYYHCHYKMYYGIDPVCNIKDFTPVSVDSKDCRHYGFCNWCDVPRVGCKKNPTAKKLVLNKLYDKREFYRSEIQYLVKDISSFAKQHQLEYNILKWFEYSYVLLYSGLRHRGKVLDVGSAKSIFPYYLASKDYAVTTFDLTDAEYRTETGHKFNVTSVTGDLQKFHPQLEEKFDFISNLSVIEHIPDDTKAVLNLARYLKRGGIMVISTDFFETYIEYPNANRTIVRDRPQGSHTDSRVYTEDTFLNRIISPLEKAGLKRMGAANYKNVDISNPGERSVRGLYTFGIACLRKPV